jgi:hypothetical protein
LWTCTYFWLDPKGPFPNANAPLTDLAIWQQPENMVALASYGLCQVNGDCPKGKTDGVSATGTRCVNYKTAKGMAEIVKAAKGHIPSNDKICYTTISLPKNIKNGLHRILYMWPFEKPEHGSGQAMYDVAYLQIGAGGADADAVLSADVDENSQADDDDAPNGAAGAGTGVGNGIGLGSFTLAQLKTQAAYWMQSPFQSKVSHEQWLASIKPKGKDAPESPSCHYVFPVKSAYKLWFVELKLSHQNVKQLN